jgi:hypothetical protein
LSTDEDWRKNQEALERLWELSRRRHAGSRRDEIGIRLASFEPVEDNATRFIISSNEIRDLLSEYMKRGYSVEPSSPEHRLQVVEEEVKDLKQRIEFIESTNKAAFIESNWFEIVAEIMTVFSQLTYVTEIYARKQDGTCDMLFVHDSADPPRAENEILDRTLVLERRFPKADFDYVILHKRETDEGDLSRRMLLYTRR